MAIHEGKKMIKTVIRRCANALLGAVPFVLGLVVGCTVRYCKFIWYVAITGYSIGSGE